MSGKILFTGFPGFLGVELLPRALRAFPDETALCLVQTRYLDLARQAAAKIEREPDLKGRVELVVGDITEPLCGLDGETKLGEVREIFHLAAVYDLAVPRHVGMKINVEGTRNVLALAERADELRRFQYVSTCYVSGRYSGVFKEEDLEKGQRFNNFYEETKFLAEIDVRRQMEKGLKATIYRPSVVVGDRETGATQKFDGPYFIIRWLLKQGRYAVMPIVGDPQMVRFNVVPRDFVVPAIAHLSSSPVSEGKTYQLADPDPLTVEEILNALERAMGKRMFRIPLPRRFAKWAIDHVPGVFRLMEIPSAAVDYFMQPTHYDTTNATTDLGNSGLTVPRFDTYLPNLIEYVAAHRKTSSAAMI